MKAYPLDHADGTLSITLGSVSDLAHFRVGMPIIETPGRRHLVITKIDHEIGVIVARPETFFEGAWRWLTVPWRALRRVVRWLWRLA